MEFYSAKNKNEILSFTGKWVELEDMISSEVSQVQKAKSHMFSLICRYTPIRNTAVLWDTDHIKGRLSFFRIR
jgi:hypothetical protein